MAGGNESVALWPQAAAHRSPTAPRTLRQTSLARRLEDRRTVGILDALDQVGINAMTAIGKPGKACRHVPRRCRPAAEHHGRVPRHHAVREAEWLDVTDRWPDAGTEQDADRHQVERLHQCFAQTGRPVETARIVLGAPDFLVRVGDFENDRCVIDDRGRGKPVFKGCRVDEGLERGTGLPLRLHRPVELAGEEIVAAGQGDGGTVHRIERHERALHRRQLGQQPAAIHGSQQVHHVPDRDHIRRGSGRGAYGVVVHPGSPAQAGPGHGHVSRCRAQTSVAALSPSRP